MQQIMGRALGLASLTIALALVVIAVCLAGTCPAQASAKTASGWNSAHTKYYVDGKAVTGVRKIGKKRYVFKQSGKLAKKRFTVGATTFYPDKKGVLRACRQGKRYYYANGKRMTKYDALDARAYFTAEKVLGKITKKSDSKATKRLKAFKWVMYKYYAMHHKLEKCFKYWAPVYAMDHFKNIGGDCESDAAAFAYLAAAIGYKNVYAVTDSSVPDTDTTHAWCRINGAVYDPLFAQAKSFSTFYNSRHGSYETSGGCKVKIPRFSAKHASKHAKRLDLSNPNKNLWVKKGNHWRYYKSNGKLAKGSVKNQSSNKRFKKGAYYVFSSKGYLLTGKKTRIVKVSGAKHRVTRKGKASSGWSSSKKYYFMKNGKMASGVILLNSKLTAFSSSGNYKSSLTSKLRAASRKGQPYTALKDLLTSAGAESASSLVQTSCITYNGSTGKDASYSYGTFSVSTFIMDTTGEEVVMGVS